MKPNMYRDSGPQTKQEAIEETYRSRYLAYVIIGCLIGLACAIVMVMT